MKRLFAIIISTLVFFTFPHLTIAALTAVYIPSSSSSLFGVSDASEGWLFIPQSDLRLTALGILDDFNNGLNDPHDAAIWDVNDTSAPLVSGTIAAGTNSPLIDNFRYVSVTPTFLEAGNQYVVAAYFPNKIDDSVINPDSYSIDPHIEFVGRMMRWSSGGGLIFPDYQDPNNNMLFGANFQFEVVPIPSALWLLGSGLIGIVGIRRKFKR